MIGFNNGKYVPLAQINVPITSLSINRSYGAFEFFEVIGGKPFYGHRHLKRFRQSLKILKLQTEFTNELEAIVEQLVVQNEINDFYIKMFALPHEAGNPEYYTSHLYVFPTQMPVYNSAIYSKGGALIIKEYERFLPEAKSTNYLFGQFMQSEIDLQKAVDVLYTNGKTIQETSRGNIFTVKNGVVFTPSCNVLKGVTRSIVVDILNTSDIPFVEKEITLEELYSAHEVFITSTTKLVVPIVTIGDRRINSGDPGWITRQIMGDFGKIKASYANNSFD